MQSSFSEFTRTLLLRDMPDADTRAALVRALEETRRLSPGTHMAFLLDLRLASPLAQLLKELRLSLQDQSGIDGTLFLRITRALRHCDSGMDESQEQQLRTSVSDLLDTLAFGLNAEVLRRCPRALRLDSDWWPHRLLQCLWCTQQQPEPKQPTPLLIACDLLLSLLVPPKMGASSVTCSCGAPPALGPLHVHCLALAVTHIAAFADSGFLRRAWDAVPMSASLDWMCFKVRFGCSLLKILACAGALSRERQQNEKHAVAENLRSGAKAVVCALWWVRARLSLAAGGSAAAVGALRQLRAALRHPDAAAAAESMLLAEFVALELENGPCPLSAAQHESLMRRWLRGFCGAASPLDVCLCVVREAAARRVHPSAVMCCALGELLTECSASADLPPILAAYDCADKYPPCGCSASKVCSFFNAVSGIAPAWLFFTASRSAGECHARSDAFLRLHLTLVDPLQPGFDAVATFLARGLCQLRGPSAAAAVLRRHSLLRALLAAYWPIVALECGGGGRCLAQVYRLRSCVDAMLCEASSTRSDLAAESDSDATAALVYAACLSDLANGCGGEKPLRLRLPSGKFQALAIDVALRASTTTCARGGQGEPAWCALCHVIEQLVCADPEVALTHICDDPAPFRTWLCALPDADITRSAAAVKEALLQQNARAQAQAQASAVPLLNRPQVVSRITGKLRLALGANDDAAASRWLRRLGF
eukprot:TRINITY_DN2021_c1_g1_i2.p1 TRINITY_DN2021_c1_g1~~TRINITY_DN2021_c1_g1_i2.p1  ORF type:complete len:710 (-),score=157.55 TRINITY_DN2021_c1_g1_i2:55-2184(-)